MDKTHRKTIIINTLDRRTQTTIFHLSTGHSGPRKHLKRLVLADSAHCECGSEEQTPDDILQTCPHLETVCQEFWPEDTVTSNAEEEEEECWAHRTGEILSV